MSKSKSKPKPDSPPPSAAPSDIDDLQWPAIAQATILAVQDAVAYLRSMETLDVAATSLALRLAAEGKEEAQAKVLEIAEAAVKRARELYEAVLKIADEVAGDDED